MDDCGDGCGGREGVCGEAEWEGALMKLLGKGLICCVRLCERIPGTGCRSSSLVKPDVWSRETGKNRHRGKRRLEDGEPVTIYFFLDSRGCRFEHAKQ